LPEIGERFHRLTVTGTPVNDLYKTGSPSPTGIPVICDCGKKKTVWLYSLLGGSCKSCGCLRSEKSAARFKTHGESDTHLHIRWLGIKSRCKGTADPENYNNRGVGMCEEWFNSFEAFRDWSIANGYSQNLQIDRINNDGNYEPSNCRWTTRRVNTRNTRRNVNLTAFGETKCAADWLNDSRCKVTAPTLRKRVLSGFDHERAISLPGTRGRVSKNFN
jgi:hypothetical protein